MQLLKMLTRYLRFVELRMDGGWSETDSSLAKRLNIIDRHTEQLIIVTLGTFLHLC